MKTLFVDALYGASGDMLLSALIDLGVPVTYVDEQLQKLSVPGLSVKTEQVRRCGIRATHMLLSWETPRTYRHYDELMAMIHGAGYSSRVVEMCENVLTRIADAEACVHSIAPEKVHFHEIGAVDTLVDVAGVALCLEYLNTVSLQFGVVTVGSGTIETEHGTMPVPAPATTEMLSGFTVEPGDVRAEVLTPTGCALLTVLGVQQPAGVSGKIVRTGYGCGDREFDSVPNVLRIFLCEEGETANIKRDTVCLLSSDMDHVGGEIMGSVAEMLFERGAIDVVWSPLYMKKGRPGYRLQVLCEKERDADFAYFIMMQTRTLGVRAETVKRFVAERKEHEGTFLGEVVREKSCSIHQCSFIKPEHESMAAIARKTGKSILELYESYLKASSHSSDDDGYDR